MTALNLLRRRKRSVSSDVTTSLTALVLLTSSNLGELLLDIVKGTTTGQNVFDE